MNNVTKVSEIKEIGWDAFLHLSRQDPSQYAAEAPDHSSDSGMSKKAMAEQKLRLLHTELLGLYGSVMPTDETAPSLRKIRSAGCYVARNSKEWNHDDRFFVLKATEHASGVWMPLIIRIIKRDTAR